MISKSQYDTYLNLRSFITQWVTPAFKNNNAIAPISDTPVSCGYKFCLHIIKILKLQWENNPL